MIINFGSINIDHVYRLPSLPEAGQTCISSSLEKFLGGKGANHSVAISRAGGDLLHVGAVGSDGQWAIDALAALGVKADAIERLECPTGHAIIYVDDKGENQIVIETGANTQLSEAMVDAALDHGNASKDWVLLQNETNLIDYIVSSAKARGYRVAYAAAPFVADVTLSLLEYIDILAVNEGEAEALAAELGVSTVEIPVPATLITKGSSGAELHLGKDIIPQKAFKVEAIDTTGAGDTFFGSFLAIYCAGASPKSSLEYAAATSAIQVTRNGAAIAVPEREEVTQFLESKL